MHEWTILLCQALLHISTIVVTHLFTRRPVWTTQLTKSGYKFKIRDSTIPWSALSNLNYLHFYCRFRQQHDLLSIEDLLEVSLDEIEKSLTGHTQLQDHRYVVTLLSSLRTNEGKLANIKNALWERFIEAAEVHKTLWHTSRCIYSCFFNASAYCIINTWTYIIVVDMQFQALNWSPDLSNSPYNWMKSFVMIFGIIFNVSIGQQYAVDNHPLSFTADPFKWGSPFFPRNVDNMTVCFSILRYDAGKTML